MKGGHSFLNNIDLVIIAEIDRHYAYFDHNPDFETCWLIYCAGCVEIGEQSIFMVRKTQIYFKLAKIFTDITSVILALAFLPGFELTLSSITLLSLVMITLLSIFGTYQLGKSLSIIQSCFRFLIAVSVTIILVFYFNTFYSLNIFEYLRVILLSFVYLLSARIILEEYEARYYRRGIGQIPILLIGMSKAGENLLEKYTQEDSLQRLNIVGFLDNSRKESVIGVPYLGKLIDLENRIEAYRPEAVIQVGNLEQAVTITAICQKYNLEYHVLPSLIGALGTRVSINNFIGFPLISVRETNLEGWGFFFKKIFDIVASLALILLLSPVFLILVMVLVIERRTWHIIVHEQRVDGRIGSEFALFRFITLIDGAHEKPLDREELRLHSVGVVKDKSFEDATRVGKFLRKTELNELPQLFNVLNNTMSMVGPRPPYKEEVEHYTNFHQKRLRLKPGITGHWQVNKGKTAGTHDDLLRQDIWYIEHWSISQDLKILGLRRLCIPL